MRGQGCGCGLHPVGGRVPRQQRAVCGLVALVWGWKWGVVVRADLEEACLDPPAGQAIQAAWGAPGRGRCPWVPLGLGQLQPCHPCC